MKIIFDLPSLLPKLNPTTTVLFPFTMADETNDHHSTHKVKLVFADVLINL